MRRWFAGVAVIFACIAIALTISYFAIGPRGVAIRLLQRIDKNVEIADIVLVNRHELRADGLVLHTTDWDIHARQVHVSFAPLQLLFGNINIDSATIDDAVVSVHPRSTDPSKPLHLPRLVAKVVYIPSAILVVDGVPLKIEHLQTKLHMQDTQLTLSNLQLGLRAEHAPIAQLAGTLELKFNGPLELHSGIAVTRSDGAGQLTIAGTPTTLNALLQLRHPIQQRIDLQLRKLGADWHLLGNTRALSLGQVTLSSVATDIILRGPDLPISLTTAYRDAHLGDAKFALRGTLNTQVITLAGTVDAAQTRLNVRSHAWWSPWRVAADFDGDDVDLAHILPGTSSRLRVRGHLDASIVGHDAQATIAAQANGLLLGRRVTATADANWDARGATLRRANLDAPGNHINAAGNWNDGIVFDANLTQLAQLSTQLAGHVTGHGKVSRHGYTVDLHGNALRVGRAISATRLDATGHGDFERSVNLDARVTQLRVPGVPPTDAHFNVAGAARDHALLLTATNAVGRFDVDGRGALTNTSNKSPTADQWRINLAHVHANLAAAGTWTNPAPLQITATRDSISGSGCLNGANASQACATNIRFSRQRVFGALYVHGLHLQQLPLPQEIAPRISGVLDLDAKANANGTAIDVQASLSKAELSGGRTPIAFTAHGTGHVPLLTNEPWRIDAAANGATFGAITATGSRAQDGRLNGHIRGNVPDVGNLQALLVATDQFLVRGPASVDLTLSGRDIAPQFAGAGTMRGTVLLPAFTSAPLPLHVEVNGELGALTIHSQLQAGDGTVHGDGNLRFRTDGGAMKPALQLKITGSKAHLFNHTDLSAVIAPNLELNATNQHVAITGQLLIEQADVRFTAVQQRDNGLSNDVVIHRSADRESAPEAANRTAQVTLPVDADVRIALGDQVRFIAAGLNTRLTGAVQLRANPDRSMRLLGHVDAADGTFAAYGVTLAIERGRLDFNGPADNPEVNVRAIRKLQEGVTDKVGVLVSGPLQRLNTQLFSEPPRTQTSALAYLITGKPLDQATTSEQARVNGAGVALGIVGLLPQTTQLRDRIGLDELEVRDALTQSKSAIVVGKQLTQRLRARYVYSVFNRSGGVQLRYRINDNLTLQTEAGAQTKAVDVVWEWQSKPRVNASP